MAVCQPLAAVKDVLERNEGLQVRPHHRQQQQQQQEANLTG
jgi:hypothetical protein